jgi:hypothetical protein
VSQAVTLQETDKEEDEQKAIAIAISRRGRTKEINVCKSKSGIPAENPELAKCN